jgi:hypothetical protein
VFDDSPLELRERFCGLVVGIERVHLAVADFSRPLDEAAPEEGIESPPPIEMYGGGQRENVPLTSIEDGIELIEEHGGNPPW